jgi:uncharacterized oligopeptide transporter (OPT) family protein
MGGIRGIGRRSGRECVSGPSARPPVRLSARAPVSNGGREIVELRNNGGAQSKNAHPRATEPATLFVTLGLSVVGAIIGLQILTTVGVTPNTSIIGVLIAILLSRIPLSFFRRFRSIHRQNLVQTNISSATFGAANSLLVPVGIPILIGLPHLVGPMLFGACMGMLIDLAMLYWFFDSRLFPGSAPWPIGIAAAEAIIAGDEAGTRGALLVGSAAAGVIGSSNVFGLLTPIVGVSALPMAAFGIAFLGNPWALTMLGLGLLTRAYLPGPTGIDINAQLIPHGMMLGAGLVALVQAVIFVVTRERRTSNGDKAQHLDPGEKSPSDFNMNSYTRSGAETRAALFGGTGLYVVAAIVLALVGGLLTEMSIGQTAVWAVFAAVSCVAAEFIVGFSAMHAGWFPAFATALIFLIISLALGFPIAAAGLLVGFVVSGGPAFADAGYDLKAGWQLRGYGRDPEFEREGRKQQIFAALLGLLTALVVVTLFHNFYFERDLFPPVVRVYAATITAGIDGSQAWKLLLWAVPGALIQLIGGPKRQIGILFSTGLLILNAAAGWAVLIAICIRLLVARGKTVEGSPLTIMAAGLIAGDAVWSFGSAIFRP